LIGARCSEISGLIAEEINRTNWIWTLPAERSKNGRPRLTPIVELARKLLDARLDITPSGPLYVTRNGLPFQSTHLGNALAGRRRQLPIAKFTTHDLRRTVVTMLTELGTPLELVAAVVGHEMGGPELRTLIKYYVRTDLLDRKAAALKAWSDWLEQIVRRREPAKLPPPLVAADSPQEPTE
jgi:integrase